jgi:hypothetical protein
VATFARGNLSEEVILGAAFREYAQRGKAC